MVNLYTNLKRIILETCQAYEKFINYVGSVDPEIAKRTYQDLTSLEMKIEDKNNNLFFEKD